MGSGEGAEGREGGGGRGESAVYLVHSEAFSEKKKKVTYSENWHMHLPCLCRREQGG